MAPELGGSQISQLLEAVPGIASVLRSPVADALVAMIRAGAGIGEFDLDDAEELVQYSVRRGLISGREGDALMTEVTAVAGKRRKRKPKSGKRPAKAAARPKKRAVPAGKKGVTKRKLARPKASSRGRSKHGTAKKTHRAAAPRNRKRSVKRR
jgi:hypothetical protein